MDRWIHLDFCFLYREYECFWVRPHGKAHKNTEGRHDPGASQRLNSMACKCKCISPAIFVKCANSAVLETQLELYKSFFKYMEEDRAEQGSVCSHAARLFRRGLHLERTQSGAHEQRRHPQHADRGCNTCLQETEAAALPRGKVSLKGLMPAVKAPSIETSLLEYSLIWGLTYKTTLLVILIVNNKHPDPL